MSDSTPSGGAGAALLEPEGDDVPRQIVTRLTLQDRIFVHGVRSVGLLVLAIVSSIGIFLGVQAIPTLLLNQPLWSGERAAFPVTLAGGVESYESWKETCLVFPALSLQEPPVFPLATSGAL